MMADIASIPCVLPLLEEWYLNREVCSLVHCLPKDHEQLQESDLWIGAAPLMCVGGF